MPDWIRQNPTAEISLEDVLGQEFSGRRFRGNEEILVVSPSLIDPPETTPITLLSGSPLSPKPIEFGESSQGSRTRNRSPRKSLNNPSSPRNSNSNSNNGWAAKHYSPSRSLQKSRRRTPAGSSSDALMKLQHIISSTSLENYDSSGGGNGHPKPAAVVTPTVETDNFRESPRRSVSPSSHHVDPLHDERSIHDEHPTDRDPSPQPSSTTSGGYRRRGRRPDCSSHQRQISPSKSRSPVPGRRRGSSHRRLSQSPAPMDSTNHSRGSRRENRKLIQALKDVEGKEKKEDAPHQVSLDRSLAPSSPVQTNRRHESSGRHRRSTQSSINTSLSRSSSAANVSTHLTSRTSSADPAFDGYEGSSHRLNERHCQVQNEGSAKVASKMRSSSSHSRSNNCRDKKNVTHTGTKGLDGEKAASKSASRRTRKAAVAPKMGYISPSLFGLPHDHIPDNSIEDTKATTSIRSTHGGGDIWRGHGPLNGSKHHYANGEKEETWDTTPSAPERGYSKTDDDGDFSLMSFDDAWDEDAVPATPNQPLE